MKPTPITDKQSLVQELISLSSALNTGDGGNILKGAEHATEHLQNIIDAVVQDKIIIIKEI